MKKFKIIIALTVVASSAAVATHAVNKRSRRGEASSLFPTSDVLPSMKKRQLQQITSWRKKYGHIHPKIRFNSVKQMGNGLETVLTVLAPVDEGDIDATLGAVRLFVDGRPITRSVAPDATGGRNWGVLRFTFLVDGSALKLTPGFHKVTAFYRDTNERVSRSLTWK